MLVDCERDRFPLGIQGERMSVRPAAGAHFRSDASRVGATRDSSPLRISAQHGLDPIQERQPRFDARDFSVNVFVIVFFSLVLLAPLVWIGANAFRLGR